MKPLDSSYSRFRYGNSANLKFRVDPFKNTKQYGSDVRAFKDEMQAQMPSVPYTWVSNGATWVINHIFKCNQVNQVDEPMTYGKNVSKWTFFKLFKL